MAKLVELLVGIRNTGKVPNWKVAKSQIVLLNLVLVLVVIVDKRFALVSLSCDSRFHYTNNTNELPLLMSSAFLVLEQDLTKSRFLILKYCDPILGYPFLHY